MVLNDVQSTPRTLQVALIHTTRALIASGIALVDIAADFLATDQEAADAFKQELKNTTEDFSHKTESVAPPTGLNAPYDHTYTPPPLDSPTPSHGLGGLLGPFPFWPPEPEPKSGWDV